MSPNWFNEFADHVVEPLLLVEVDGLVVAANRAAGRLLGTTAGENLGDRARDPEAFRHTLHLASRSPQPLPGALELDDGDEARWRYDASRSRVGDDAAPARVFLHLRSDARAVARFAALNAQIERLHDEVRRRQRLEEERGDLLERERQARQEAEEASRLKDEFLAAVSHELRTPLNAITGWLNLLRMKPTAQELDQALEVLERNVKVQTHLIDDLVDVSRVVTGRMRLDLEPVDLAEVVRQAVDSVRPTAESKELRLVLIADPGGCIVNADPQRMLQVVWNLLSNATKFTPRGGRIQVLLRRVNSHAEIVVSDTGCGIAEDDLPYVFDRFRQADGTITRKYGGLGLGLAIVRHLVELHGGVVMAHSDGVDQGATFTVNLPLPIFERRTAVRSPIDEPAAGEEGPASLQLIGCRVLLIEDHEDSRTLLEKILRASGATVVAVASADAALASYAKQPSDVVISDIELPEEDGFTLMRKLRDLERHLGLEVAPAIAVTAHSTSQARVHALRCGYQSFLAKPIQPPELVALVSSVRRLATRAAQDDGNGDGGDGGGTSGRLE